mmetsp:Transcript_29359/g.44445  ORF Transcript_29359/g.44445 Transcript_29359/m.44445 type:complete len:136 (+) Transcript_29359:639-1046(+)|eukprot:CAMPEP_0178920782 /NCGR_PEP_ID=MMETSP0786-20121207/15190_1 /TAXON_ID=186022 /ORGANISM="Thalassionema frauenfeldii, Strain CCMP 1798" /LENGTH=135 /DNA_ID=CAMNT_0020594875 /DNA_START=583 /DNA_END=990 /DNA_ORIENTATION=-
MGILKHAVLPLFAAVHAGIVGLYLSENLGWMKNYPDIYGAQSQIELHLLSIVAGSSLMMMFGCLIGILQEDSHFRGIIAVMNFGIFANEAYDSWFRDGFDPTLSTILTVIAGFGVIVHSNEPGFFTQDKAKKKDM